MCDDWNLFNNIIPVKPQGRQHTWRYHTGSPCSWTSWCNRYHPSEYPSCEINDCQCWTFIKSSNYQTPALIRNCPCDVWLAYSFTCSWPASNPFQACECHNQQPGRRDSDWCCRLAHHTHLQSFRLPAVSLNVQSLISQLLQCLINQTITQA